MKKIPWYKKIQIQIPLIVFLIILIPAAAFGYYDISTSRQAQLLSAKTSTADRLAETAFLMQNVMQEIEKTGKTLLEDSTFAELLSNYQSSPENPKLQSGISLAMGQSAWPCSYIENMYLIVDGAPFILSTDPEEKRQPVTSSGLALSQSYLGGMRGQTTWASFSEDGADKPSIAYWRSFNPSEEDRSCSLVCVLKAEYLENALSGLTGSRNLISSYQGRILYCDSPETPGRDNDSGDPETAALFRKTYSEQENAGSYFASSQGARWLVTYYNSLEDGWKYSSAIPEQQIYTGIADRQFLSVLLTAGLFSVFFGSLALYYLVVSPLNRLREKMELMENGRLETLDSSGSKNEIGLVLRAYNHMIVKLKELIDEVYVQQLLRKQAELSSLQSQMDEHFLYNTLNTIYCKTVEEHAAVSSAMVLKLSQHFRLSLAEGQEKIPLSEIVELIRAYLQIQQLRYGASLRCEIKTFPGLENYISLKQLYQPIIENAVIHGFEKKLGNHRLQISFEKQDAGEEREGRLLFTVCDDGVGMSKDILEGVIAKMDTFDRVEGDGYALRNIREQIRITYGENYGIKIESEKGRGTTVVLEVPLERRESCQENIQ